MKEKTCMKVSIILILILTSCYCPKVTRKNWMDNKSYKLVNNFQFGDYSKDFSVAITRQGKIFIKENIEANSPEYIHNWEMTNL